MFTGDSIRWQDMCRIKAVIITNDGKIYEDDNHQYCLQSFTKDYLSDYDLSDDSDLEEAIKLTDHLFKNGQFHGFDVFEDRDGKGVFASHYARAFDNAIVYDTAREYANKNGLILSAFKNADKLGDVLMAVA